MTVLSSHTGRGLSAQELASGNFQEALKWWDRCIADHKAAGMSYIVTPWMDVPGSLKDLETYCRYYNEIGKRCRENGLLYGYHNHAHEFQKVEGETMYDYMLSHTDPENVFFQMDVYWVVRGQNSPVDYFFKFPGMVGFDAIFRNVKKAGVMDIVAEIESYSGEVLPSVRQSFDYLNQAEFVPYNF